MVLERDNLWAKMTKVTQPDVRTRQSAVVYEDINKLTRDFIQNCINAQWNYKWSNEKMIEAILKQILFSIRYNAIMRNLITSKLVPLLVDEKNKTCNKEDITILQNLFEVVRCNNKETNDTQKTLSTILGLASLSNDDKDISPEVGVIE